MRAEEAELAHAQGSIAALDARRCQRPAAVDVPQMGVALLWDRQDSLAIGGELDMADISRRPVERREDPASRRIPDETLGCLEADQAAAVGQEVGELRQGQALALLRQRF